MHFFIKCKLHKWAVLDSLEERLVVSSRPNNVWLYRKLLPFDLCFINYSIYFIWLLFIENFHLTVHCTVIKYCKIFVKTYLPLKMLYCVPAWFLSSKAAAAMVLKSMDWNCANRLLFCFLTSFCCPAIKCCAISLKNYIFSSHSHKSHSYQFHFMMVIGLSAMSAENHEKIPLVCKLTSFWLKVAT